MPSTIFLHRLRLLRTNRGLRRVTLAVLTEIDESRLADLESAKYEPFLDETIIIHRALNTSGIVDLITSPETPLVDLNAGIPLPTDVDMLRAGVRLPLSVAVRICTKLGLNDPSALYATGLERDLWSVMSTLRNDRCPWCHADTVNGAAHADDCLPSILWSERDRDLVGTLGAFPHPQRPGKGRRASGKALGLRRERVAAGMLSKHLAEAIGLRADYLSKIENGSLALTVEKAAQISNVLRIDPARLYVADESVEDTSTSVGAEI